MKGRGLKPRRKMRQSLAALAAEVHREHAIRDEIGFDLDPAPSGAKARDTEEHDTARLKACPFKASSAAEFDEPECSDELHVRTVEMVSVA